MYVENVALGIVLNPSAEQPCLVGIAEYPGHPAVKSNYYFITILLYMLYCCLNRNKYKIKNSNTNLLNPKNIHTSQMCSFR